MTDAIWTDPPWLNSPVGQRSGLKLSEIWAR